LVTTLPGPEPEQAQPRPPSEEDTLLGNHEVAVVRRGEPSPDPKTIGRYEVLDRLGEGGMGLIFTARDPELDRKVAVKLVRPALHEKGRDTRQRLLREAQALAKINHPNVIHVYEVGTYEDQVYVAMEFVDGKTLRDWQWQPHVSWRRILEAYLAAGRGLAAAHEREMVHRDFKPDNVLVDKEGKVRVIDFGLARAGGTVEEEVAAPADDVELVQAATIDVGRALTRLTKTGAILGTPAYMAPEQHRGDAADARTDQFSFCVALYEALYGMRPFGGATYPVLVSNVLDGRVEEEPRFVEVPLTVRRALLKGLSVEPNKRFADMHALIQELRRDPNAAQRRWRMAGGAALAVAIAAGTWSSFQDTDRVEAEGRRLRNAANADRIAHLETRAERAGEEDANWNDFLLARAATRLSEDPSKAVGTLAWLEDPTPEQHASVRLLAARALEKGVGKRIELAGDYGERLAVSPDGERFVVSGPDGVVHHVRDGFRVTVSTESKVNGVAIAAQAEVAVAGLASGSVVLIRADGPQSVEKVDRPVTAIAVSADAKQIAVGVDDGRILTFGVEGDRAELLREFGTHTGPVRSLAFSADGTRLASGADDGKMIRWRLAEKKLKDIEPGAVGITQVAWSDDGRIYGLGSNGELTSWDPSGRQPGRVATHVQTFALVGDEALALDAEGKVITAPPRFAELTLPGGVAALSVDLGQRVVTLDANGNLRRLTVKSSEPDLFAQSSARGRFLRLSADSQSLLAATFTDGVEVHDLGSRELTLALESVEDPILELGFAPDASALAVMTQNGSLHLISADGKRHETKVGGQALVEASFVWAPDSKSLATLSCHEKCGLLVYRQDGSLRAHGDVPPSRYRARLEFGPESRWLYVEAPGEAPAVMDANDGRLVQLEWAGEMPMTRLAQRWSATQGLVVAGLDAEGKLQIWQRGPETGTMHPIHEQAVERALADLSGRDLFVRESAGDATLWHLDQIADPIALPPLPAAAELALSPDADWLLLHPQNRTDHRTKLVHLGSGTTLDLASVPLGAVVTGEGSVLALDGHALRITDAPVPRDWRVLLTWIDAVSDGRVNAEDLVAQ
jgi:tRNA A-37 threonylcarbamoyl transferase component Bud32